MYIKLKQYFKERFVAVLGFEPRTYHSFPLGLSQQAFPFAHTAINEKGPDFHLSLYIKIQNIF